MEKVEPIQFPPARIVRRSMSKKPRKPIAKPLVAAKKSPVLIVWTGLVIIARAAVPATVYVLAGGAAYRLLGL